MRAGYSNGVYRVFKETFGWIRCGCECGAIVSIQGGIHSRCSSKAPTKVNSLAGCAGCQLEYCLVVLPGIARLGLGGSKGVRTLLFGEFVRCDTSVVSTC